MCLCDFCGYVICGFVLVSWCIVLLFVGFCIGKIMKGRVLNFDVVFCRLLGGVCGIMLVYVIVLRMFVWLVCKVRFCLLLVFCVVLVWLLFCV